MTLIEQTATCSIGECLLQSTCLAAVSDSPRLDAELLLIKVLEKGRTYLYTWPEERLTPAQQSHYDRLLQRRLQGEPVAHLLGYREFWNLKLAVSPATLIPRPETEVLVAAALALLPADGRQVLDLGTGTGAVALALASERPAWHLTAVDKSPAAVNLAIENCRRLSLQNVAIGTSDWFTSVLHQRFDLIVANPPYVADNDPHLQQGDLRFEPPGALVSGADGLAAIRLIISQAPDYLLPGGWLLLEHGFNQADAVRQLMLERGLQSCYSLPDLAGHPRVTGGQWRC